MKKLLLSLIAGLTAVSLQAQPVTQNTAFAQPEYNEQNNVKLLRGDLAPFVSGGTPPYRFEKEQPIENTTLQIVSTGEHAGKFAAKPTPSEYQGPAKFNYRVTDSTGQVSNVATVTIIFGQEKG